METRKARRKEQLRSRGAAVTAAQDREVSRHRQKREWQTTKQPLESVDTA